MLTVYVPLWSMITSVVEVGTPEGLHAPFVFQSLLLPFQSGAAASSVTELPVAVVVLPAASVTNNDEVIVPSVSEDRFTV